MNITCPKCGLVFRVNPRRKQKHSNVFHKLNGAYATALAMDPEWTKATLKYWYGTWVPYPFPDDVMPEWPGRFVELFEGTPDHSIVYLKSETAYSKDEETRLVAGAKSACIDIGADIDWIEI